jgi:uncharacterized protein YyaL (SSP411 family)
MPLMVGNVALWNMTNAQVVIAGQPGAEDTSALEAVVSARYLPAAVVVPVSPDHADALGTVMPWTSGMARRDGQATAYVCQDFTCQTPVTAAADLAGQSDVVAAPRLII